MSTRAHISVKRRVDVAINQAEASGIICPLCKYRLYADEPRILEHMVPHEFTKDNSVKNLRWVHKACADLKTDGPKHLKVAGDKSKIAKAKRLANGPKKSKNPMPKTHQKLQAHVDPWRKAYRAKLEAQK